jgi:predicted  nucleic acid-binding Zn-ribbon protein
MAFPYAACDGCGWLGRRDELREGTDRLAECCPECGSTDTQYLSADAYEKEMRDGV